MSAEQKLRRFAAASTRQARQSIDRIRIGAAPLLWCPIWNKVHYSAGRPHEVAALLLYCVLDPFCITARNKMHRSFTLLVWPLKLSRGNRIAFSRLTVSVSCSSLCFGRLQAVLFSIISGNVWSAESVFIPSSNPILLVLTLSSAVKFQQYSQYGTDISHCPVTSHIYLILLSDYVHCVKDQGFCILSLKCSTSENSISCSLISECFQVLPFMRFMSD